MSGNIWGGANNVTIVVAQFTQLESTNMKRLLAFTLAETLVVMGIIGVVAALTIPNLNQSTGNREKVAKVKKIYSNLSDVYGRATAVYGPLDEWFTNIDDDDWESLTLKVRERMVEFMKISKTCEYNDKSCIKLFPDNDPFASYKSYILADGTGITFVVKQKKFLGGIENNGCGYVYIDIDGPHKGKSKGGYDIFSFVLTKDGFMPEGETNPLNCFSESGNQVRCTAWVIQNDNMDYLLADAKTGKCLNSDVTLSLTETSCK